MRCFATRDNIDYSVRFDIEDNRVKANIQEDEFSGACLLFCYMRRGLIIMTPVAQDCVFSPKEFKQFQDAVRTIANCPNLDVQAVLNSYKMVNQ